jgi:5-methylcytosine-specific restriction endonuclease McrA
MSVMSATMATTAGKKLQQRRWMARQLAKVGFATGGLTTNQQHAEYIKTPQWQLVRDRKFAEQLERRGFSFCERCGEKEPEQVARETALHVHHLTYERLGEELLEDLQIICRPCHENEHGHDTKGRHYRPGERS